MKRTFLHPLPLRIWHWLHAVIVIILIFTGLYLRLHGIAALRPHDSVLLWHKRMGLAMLLSTIFWFVYTVWSGNLRRLYGIGKRDLAGMLAQANYYLFSIFTGGENPFKASADDKYNPLQKMAYDAVMFIFLPVLGFTGLLFLDIPVVRRYLLSENLLGLVGAVHVLFSYVIVLFLIVHLYLVTLGDTVFSHTRAMITGYEETDTGVKEEEGTQI
jgi:thiosulfate reductase cytochrome b subunit